MVPKAKTKDKGLRRSKVSSNRTPGHRTGPAETDPRTIANCSRCTEGATLGCPGSQVVCGQLAARKEAASIPNWSVATDAEKVGRSCEDAFANLLAGWTDRNMTAYLARG